MYNVWILVLCGVIAYFLGSIPFSYIFTKKIRNEDIREKGSGNAGTTNVLRTYGWGMGLLTFAGDMLKGLLAALIGSWLGGEVGLCIAAVLAVAGHNYSCFLKFKGGKGIAATIGVLLVIQTIPTLVVFAIAIVIVAISKMMSLGSLLGLVMSAIAAFLITDASLAKEIAVIAIAALGFVSHRENIVRLIHGQERKLSISKKKHDIKKA
ncbi:MAG: glycerol-3-phosphate 1-O-acyltransferase PlsY [Christensenellaceae bacterium]